MAGGQQSVQRKLRFHRITGLGVCGCVYVCVGVCVVVCVYVCVGVCVIVCMCFIGFYVWSEHLGPVVQLGLTLCDSLPHSGWQGGTSQCPKETEIPSNYWFRDVCVCGCVCRGVCVVVCVSGLVCGCVYVLLVFMYGLSTWT